MGPNNKWARHTFVWVLLVLASIFIWFTFLSNHTPPAQVDANQLAQDIKANKVTKIVSTTGSDDIKIYYADQKDPKLARLPPNTNILDLLKYYSIDLAATNVSLETEAASQWGGVLSTLTFILPTLFLVGIFVFMMRQAQGSNNQAISFGKSRARMFTGNRPTVTFADVAGVEEAKQELQEVVEFLKYPDKFAALGARIPRGVLLVGPPGTGKTLLSRAVAGEAGVPFFSISGSEFVEMFVGVGASRVRDLFDQAKRNAPCIIFIDEIDAVGRQRGAGLGGSHDEREQTLNQILVEMDGFDSSTNVIVIAATNRPDVLDPALLRPGRFDRQVILDRPDVKGRQAILEVHTRGKPLEDDCNPEALAKQTPGFSGADLENLVNEAAILAARRNKKTIGKSELEEAIDRVQAGPERKSKVISEREKIMTAYHEAGHATTARVLPNADPVHKISIVARGMMGGYTRYLPEEDRSYYTRSQFRDLLVCMLGGHVAERLVFDELSTGASNDIERATALARKMVTEFGMSDNLGTVAYGKKEEMIFLGREIGEQRNYSESVAVKIDDEVKAIIDEAYQRATDILTTYMPQMQQIVGVLMERETIDGVEIDQFFEAPKPRPRLVGPPVTEPALVAMTREERQAVGRAGDGRVERPDRPEPDAPPTGRLTPQPA
ncbi:MAG TPA: ATP-dependent zinc metalloprotease FtsH [Thermomicrobiales bacterium]|nr:ATP-dependent zinc metalloprotease FtsH [Thermomicrobiales bacterium]